MTTALIEGETAQRPEREKALRRQPEGPEKFSRSISGYSALARPHQGETTPRVGLAVDHPHPAWPIFERHSQVAKIVARMRRDQITALLRDRNRGPCLTDDAILFLEEVLPHIAIACGPATYEFNAGEWVALNTPLLTKDQVTGAIVRILPNPPRYASLDIGQRMNVSEAEWERLELSHIRPAGWTRRILKTKRRARHAVSRKAARHARGESKTRREDSASRTKQWLAAGFKCRRTWERHGKPGPVAA